MIFSKLQVVQILIYLLCIIDIGYSQTTYTVTSTSKDGPGSINEAITLANNNPGADIIEFTPNLQINASHPSFTGNSNSFMIDVTESVTINGMGGALNGFQKWVRSDGATNDLTKCPGVVPNTTILRSMPGFINIGVVDQDNSAINVTVKNLSIKQFNAVAAVRKNATLILEDFNATEVWSTLNCKARGLLDASEGASISIKNSNFTNSVNWASSGFRAPAIVSSSNAGDLTIDNCLFYDINDGNQYVITWTGATSSKVNVVSSRLLGVGGLLILGATSETNLVNSTMVSNSTGTPGVGQRIRNLSSGPINIISSSIKWNSNQCSDMCDISPLILIESSNGAINLSETGIGFNFPSSTGTLLTTLGGAGAGFTADANTWIEPTSNQNAIELQSITSQPNLITAIPGFKSGFSAQVEYNDTELVAPDVSGVLIDVINTPLLNPIDGNPITTDVLGNSRFDVNGMRDIGAIQLSLAPSLTITDNGDQFVNLSWQEPLHHDGDPIIRYEYEYVATSGGAPTIVDVGLNLTANVTGLTNGITYKFSVRAIYDEGGIEVNGPYSNSETATPLSLEIPAPTVTATSGGEQVSLSWSLADLGGRTFNSYIVLWKVDGASRFTGGEVILDPNTTSKIITGLTYGINYEFKVSATATNGDRSDYGADTATPFSLEILAPTVTATPGNEQVSLSWSPADLGGRTFNSYVVLWKVNGASSFSGGEVILDLNTTSKIITDLTYGINYEFKVSATATNGDRSDYGIDTATPLSLEIPAPTVTATPGDEQVNISWSPANLGGRTFNSYIVQWKVNGALSLTGNEVISDINTTSKIITGLTNKATYEFNVAVTATNGDRSDYGIAIATLNLFYPNPVDNIFYINSLDKNINVKLFSINRALLKEVENNKIIDISDFSTGTYILYIQTKNKEYSRKIIKN